MEEFELGDICGQRPETASHPEGSGGRRLARITQDNKERAAGSRSGVELDKYLWVSFGPSAWLRGQMARSKAT